MSGSDQQQPNKPSKGSRQRTSSNPFEGSALLSSAPALPTLPTSPSASPVQPHPPAASSGEQQTPLLYNSQPPPDYILRQFERRHDRQTIYIDARKAGALDALVKLAARGNKTDLIDEMVSDLLNKYASLLQENEELVRILEDHYRKKHNL